MPSEKLIAERRAFVENEFAAGFLDAGGRDLLLALPANLSDDDFWKRYMELNLDIQLMASSSCPRNMRPGNRETRDSVRRVKQRRLNERRVALTRRPIPPAVRTAPAPRAREHRAEGASHGSPDGDPDPDDDPDDPPGRRCAVCPASLAGKRAHAKTCSGACRKKLARQNRNLLNAIDAAHDLIDAGEVHGERALEILILSDRLLEAALDEINRQQVAEARQALAREDLRRAT